MATIVRNPGPVRRVDAALWAAREAAHRTRQEAELQAGEILAAAHAESDAIRAAAAARGRDEGLAASAAVLARAAAQRDRALAAVEGELAAMAVEIARRVVGAAAERVPDVAARAATEAVAAARGRGRVVVRANPDELRIVEAALAGVPAEVVAAGEVGRGGVVVCSADGAAVDARAETRLELVARALLEAP